MKKRTIILCILCGLFAMATQAAVSTYWTGTTGNFTDSANWSIRVPLNGDTVYLDEGNITVNYDLATSDVYALMRMGYTAGTTGINLNINSGTMNVRDVNGVPYAMAIGMNSGSEACVNMTSGTLNIVDGGGTGSPDILLGYQGGTGELILSGGMVNVAGKAVVGASSGSSGFLQVQDGVLNLNGGGFTKSSTSAYTQIDVWQDGVINIVGQDWTSSAQSWISSGYLVGEGGAKELSVEYIGGNTVITTVPEPATITLVSVSSVLLLIIRRFINS